MNTNDDSEVVPDHARRVVRSVLDRWVVKKTAPEINGQEMADLSLLGSDLPVALNEQLDNANPLVAVLAAWLLLKLAETNGPYSPKQRSMIDRAIQVLVEAVKAEKPAVALYAVILMSNGGVPADAVPYLISLLGHLDSAFAVYSASCLSWCGESAAQAIPVLTKALHGDEELLGCVAASALGRLGLRNQEVISVLIRRLSEDNSPQQYSIVLALKELGDRAAASASKLFAIASNRKSNSRLRAAAAESLVSVQKLNPETMQLLKGFLAAAEWPLIDAGVRCLAQLGVLSEDVLPRLAELVRSGDENLRRVAATGYRLLGAKAESGMSDLIRAICEEANRDILVELAAACVFLGPPAAKPLCDVIKQGPLQRVGGACVALQLMGRLAAPEIARSLLVDTDEVVRRMAVSLLRSLGTEAIPALPIIVEIFPSLDDERAIDAIETIQNCGADADIGFDLLVGCLLERRGAVANAAAAVLTKFGTKAITRLHERLLIASESDRVKIESYLKSIHHVANDKFDRLIALNADQDFLLFLVAGQVIETAGTIGLRKVAIQLEANERVARLNLPASEASVRMTLADLNQKLPSPINRQTTKGTQLTDDGRKLLRELPEYLRWRGFDV